MHQVCRVVGLSRSGQAALALALVTLALLVVAGPAAANLYWSDETGDRVGKSTINGSGPNPNFISGAGETVGLDANASHVFWVDRGDGDPGDGSIARATKKGDGVNPTFIGGLTDPRMVAVTDDHIYWTTATSIGRANLDGTGINRTFITAGVNSARGIAAGDTHIYWINGATGSIARSNLSGTGVNPNFVTGLGTALGVEVNEGMDSLYWATFLDASGTDSWVGRADLDGSNVDREAFPAEGAYDVSAAPPYIYWTNRFTGRIGRADLATDSVNQSLISGLGGPYGLAAVDPKAKVKIKVSKKHGIKKKQFKKEKIVIKGKLKVKEAVVVHSGRKADKILPTDPSPPPTPLSFHGKFASVGARFAGGVVSGSVMGGCAWGFDPHDQCKDGIGRGARGLGARGSCNDPGLDCAVGEWWKVKFVPERRKDRKGTIKQLKRKGRVKVAVPMAFTDTSGNVKGRRYYLTIEKGF